MNFSIRNEDDFIRQQQRNVCYIVTGVRQRGRAPTAKEICAKFGSCSPDSVTEYLKEVEKKGYIEWRGSPLGMRLIWDRVWERLGIPIVDQVPTSVP